jgi:V-type H+-transporting ATPase subunit a
MKWKDNAVSNISLLNYNVIYLIYLKQIGFLKSQLEKNDISNRPLINAPATRTAQEIDDLEETLKVHEQRVTQMNNSFEELAHSELQLVELRHVLHASSVFFNQKPSQEDLLADIEELEQGAEQLGYAIGVIPRTKMFTFERVLWRILRGNLYMNFVEIDDPIVDPEDPERKVYKNVFAIFAHGHEIINKIKRISESMGATLYTVDDHPDKRREALIEITTRIEDLNIVLNQTKQARRNELLKVSDHFTAWYTTVRKEKAIYHTMNLFNYDVNRKCLIAEGWCPKLDVPIIRIALKTATESSGTNMPSVFSEIPATKRKPPTYHRTNKFTEGFQNIIDAYGIARYREVNTGLFTIVSFPFLFAIMFGDIGHGFLMLCFALYLVLNEKKLANVNDEIFSMFFSGRYMVLMMAIFSIFTGAIYNDMFSLSLNLFKSGYDWIITNETKTEMTAEGVPTGHIYPFGLDPVSW